MSFAKLDSGIVNSTLWVLPDDVLRVWIWLLSQADANGIVRTAAPALALVCMKSIDRIREIMLLLESPDHDSRSEVDEGRRIRKVSGGWQIINYRAYRERVAAEEKRANDRERIAEKRAAARFESSDVAAGRAVSQPVAKVAQAEVEVEVEEEVEAEDQKIVPHSAKSRAARLPKDWQPTVSEMRWAADARPDVDAQAEVEKFRDYWHAKAGHDACKRDWSATWRNWIRNSHGSPRARGSPQSAPSKMASAMAALEEMKHGKTSGTVVPRRNPDGVAETRAIESR